MRTDAFLEIVNGFLYPKIGLIFDPNKWVIAFAKIYFQICIFTSFSLHQSYCPGGVATSFWCVCCACNNVVNGQYLRFFDFLPHIHIARNTDFESGDALSCVTYWAQICILHSPTQSLIIMEPTVFVFIYVVPSSGPNVNHNSAPSKGKRGKKMWATATYFKINSMREQKSIDSMSNERWVENCVNFTRIFHSTHSMAIVRLWTTPVAEHVMCSPSIDSMADLYWIFVKNFWEIIFESISIYRKWESDFSVSCWNPHISRTATIAEMGE